MYSQTLKTLLQVDVAKSTVKHCTARSSKINKKCIDLFSERVYSTILFLLLLEEVKTDLLLLFCYFCFIEGSGIGRCAAHELSSLGAHVSIVGRKLEKLERVKREIDESNGICSIHECDIRDEDNVVKMVSSIVGKYGKIDGLVNNAGGQFQSPLEQISAKGWDAVVRTNLTGGFIVARECYKQSMKEKGGSIVNIIADMWMVSNYILFFYFF